MLSYLFFTKCSVTLSKCDACVCMRDACGGRGWERVLFVCIFIQKKEMD